MHNEAEYLSECIESVLAQTYQNWDCTIVDNCSTDGSRAIANRYAAQDSRIRVHVNEQLLPPIANHNAALRQVSSHSKYCKVVFADDWIFPECLERMVRLAEEHSSVGVVGAYCLEGEQVICTGLPFGRSVVDGREMCRRTLLEKLHLFGSSNSLLYRADLLRAHDPFLNEANVHADTEVCFRLLKNCDFGFVHQVLTFTRLRRGSLNTVSLDRGSYFPGMLWILRNYGQDYLSPEELKRYRDSYVSEYYRFLGKSLLMGRDEKFWQYHKTQLMVLQHQFSGIRVAQGVLSYLGNRILRPWGTLTKSFSS
jgi:glycosyltransferase involved in cell wall biosynthesis